MVCPSLNILGIMSGTSLDGLDLAIVKIDFKSGKYSFKISKSKTIKYTEEWEDRLKNARFITGEKLTQLNIDYGRLLGQEAESFCDEPIDLIASHGHTVFHQPELGVTLQIGSLNEIALITGVKTVGDFRTMDVAKGGQGAPLVPIGDLFLFREYDYCINLGGISNISLDKHGVKNAMDLSPCNIVSNYFSNQIGLGYDKNGDIGRRGNVNLNLLQKLNDWQYYNESASSLGIERIEKDFLPIFDQVDLSVGDKLRTYYEHIGFVIGNELLSGKALFTGGGVKNSMLLDCIKANSKSEVVVPNEQIVDFKEAVIFAFLGFLRINNQINILASVTGASSDSSSGIVVNCKKEIGTI
jgi:anhydro-N-acetylmuramic acid kinase